MLSSRNWLVAFNTSAGYHHLGCRLFIGLLSVCVGIGGFAAIAQAEVQHLRLTIDGTQSPSFEDLVQQAETLAASTVVQQFQTHSNLTEIEVTILGERNGQIVSLLSSRVMRETGQREFNLQQWTRYFPASSVLLGYRNSAPVSRRSQPQPIASNAGFAPLTDPTQRVEEAFREGRISANEYYELIDALD